MLTEDEAVYVEAYYFLDKDGNGCEKYKEECDSIISQNISNISLIDPFRRRGANNETALVCKECGCSKIGMLFLPRPSSFISYYTFIFN